MKTDAEMLRMCAVLLNAMADRLDAKPTIEAAPRPPLEDAVWAVVTNYEQKVLWKKHRGRRQTAGRARQTLRHSTTKAGFMKLAGREGGSPGLAALAALGEPTLEQVAINYADELPVEFVENCRAELARARASLS